ncbi:UNKNOWN [Stylonychia lemnae]|uniref:Uncharacterized protein n=1 Tax=Stylonychia lemnae TaxID=5949 RepID=A0A078AF51_STYLE|nr:UNKNOWN [Stylonychia lemnae]|eukprot:CDW80152.1 UNKNOWN [Stylonychia lemnae]
MKTLRLQRGFNIVVNCNKLRHFSTKKEKDFDFNEFFDKKKREKAQQKFEQQSSTYAEGEYQNSQDQDNTRKFNANFNSQQESRGGSQTIMQLPSQIAKDLVLMNLPKYKKRLDDKFKDLNDAYERLQKWVEERDQTLDENLMNNKFQNMGNKIDTFLFIIQLRKIWIQENLSI